MSDKVRMPADGGDPAKEQPDGVNSPEQRGRSGGGESGGGAYVEGGPPARDKSDGFMGHGGQTDIAYHGSGQAGAEGPRAGNGVTSSEGEPAQEGETDPKPEPSVQHQDRIAEQTRTEAVGGRAIEISETSGVAAAEVAGNTGVEGQRRHEGEQPGSG